VTLRPTAMNPLAAEPTAPARVVVVALAPNANKPAPLSVALITPLTGAERPAG
jgi:hypothetical protein